QTCALPISRPSAASTPELKFSLLTFFCHRRCLPLNADTSPFGSIAKTTPLSASRRKRNGSAASVEATLVENTGTSVLAWVSFGSGFGFTSGTLLVLPAQPANASVKTV